MSVIDLQRLTSNSQGPVAAQSRVFSHVDNERLNAPPLVTLGRYLVAVKVRYSLGSVRRRELMIPDNNHAMMEEIVLPEHLLPVGSVLGDGVSTIDLCTVLAKIFRVQSTEVALLRLDGGLLRFIFPDHLRTT